MIGPLTTNKEPARTRTPMCWLSENIKELVQETGNHMGPNVKKLEPEFALDDRGS